MNLSDLLLGLCFVLSLVAAIFAFLAFLGGRQTGDELTVVKATQLLRDETEIIRGAMEGQSRGIRQDLFNLIAKFQEATFGAFGGLREGIEGQVRNDQKLQRRQA